MNTLYFLFCGDTRAVSWQCCFNAWLSFWPGMAFGGILLGFDSELIGRIFIFSDS